MREEYYEARKGKVRAGQGGENRVRQGVKGK